MALAVAVCSLVPFVAGCGGASKQADAVATTVAGSPTRAQYIAQADAICARFKSEANYKGEHLKELLKAFHGYLDAQEIAESQIPQEIRKFAAFWRARATQLQALGAPTPDIATIGKMEVDRSNIASDLENFASAARNADRSGIEAAETALRESKAAYYGLEQGYGFKVCGAAEG